jgi:hypothetical protein
MESYITPEGLVERLTTEEAVAKWGFFGASIYRCDSDFEAEKARS